jgi:hypothetical protein
MKLRRDIASTLLAILSVWLLGIAHISFATETTSNTNAPTGLYVSLSDLPERFVVDLKTNGAYTVLSTGMSTNSQSGVWKWDDAKREFRLTPGTNGGAFSYELRVLRIDPRQPDTLQWIPLHGIGTATGAIDYVRFKRKDG